MKKITMGAILSCFYVYLQDRMYQAQLLKNLKDKVNQAADKVVGKKLIQQ